VAPEAADRTSIAVQKADLGVRKFVRDAFSAAA
jgi:hypothetical protein